MRGFFLAGFLLLSLSLFGQDTLVVKGNKVKVLQDSVLLSRGSLKNGKPHGKWLYFDADGNKTHQLNYRRGVLHHGHYFNPDGSIHHSVNRRGRVFVRRSCNC